MVDIVPPMLKSLTTSTSPFMWHGVAAGPKQVKANPPPLLVVVVGLILFWRNQNPFCASPELSKRSMPKKTSLHGVEAVDPGQLTSAGVLYRAAKPLRRMSLPGRPPDPWFQAQLEMSMGSLEPPPVKVVPLLAGWKAQARAVLPGIVTPVVVPQGTPVADPPAAIGSSVLT